MLLRIVLSLLVILAGGYASLIGTSDPLPAEREAMVRRAIGVIEAKGFSREAFILKHVAVFRGSDHWLNRATLADRSFASTNFPFQIITVYYDFEWIPKDDTERAMVLLHEARHLMGDGEKAAYRFVWENRDRLGWNEEGYGTTPSYRTIKQETERLVPEIFSPAE